MIFFLLKLILVLTFAIFFVSAQLWASLPNNLNAAIKANLMSKLTTEFNTLKLNTKPSLRQTADTKHSRHGYVYQALHVGSVEQASQCSSPSSVYGEAANTCFTNELFSYKYQVADEGCAGAEIEFFADSSCTNFIGSRPLAAYEDLCEKAPFTYQFSKEMGFNAFQSVHCTTSSLPVISLEVFDAPACAGLDQLFDMRSMDISTYSSSVGYYSPSDCSSSTAISFNFKATTLNGKEQELTALCYLDNIIQEVDDINSSETNEFYYEPAEEGSNADDDLMKLMNRSVVVDVDDDDLVEAMENARANGKAQNTIIGDDDVFNLTTLYTKEDSLVTDNIVDGVRMDTVVAAERKSANTIVGDDDVFDLTEFQSKEDDDVSPYGGDDDDVATKVVDLLFGPETSTTTITTTRATVTNPSGYNLMDQMLSSLANMFGPRTTSSAENMPDEPAPRGEEEKEEEEVQLYFLGFCQQQEHPAPSDEFILQEEQMQQRRLQLNSPTKQWQGKWSYSATSPVVQSIGAVYVALAVAAALIVYAMALSLPTRSGLLKSERSSLKIVDALAGIQVV